MPEATHRGRRTDARLAMGVLVTSQLLAGLGVATGIAVGGILVEDMTGAVALAGLAQTAIVLGAGLLAVPMARIAVARGRHVALASGYAASAVGAVLIVVAAVTGLAWVLIPGFAGIGAATAAGLQARFAAPEVVRPEFQARAMSLVLWATTIGAVAGPNLSQWGDDVGRGWGLPSFVGPFAFSFVAFAICAVLVAALLRTPPAGTLQDDEPDAEASDEPAPSAFRALRTAVREPQALLAVLAIVTAHTVMVGVMVMTPVHLHVNGLGIPLIGLVVSIHILGMYGASPLVGWLVDRIGTVRVIGIGVVVLAAAVTVGGFFGSGFIGASVALGLLGLGWSAGLIGGSALLTHAVDRRLRVPLQGATDAAMNLAAAASAAFSGLILSAGGYGAVNAVAAVLLLPVVVAAIRVVVRKSALTG
ncbi:putative MFS-type transporter YdeG [Agromyces rhizosphaerae]|uniref:MFS-type transporter YdeG n=1 Tax=Agromyces rhizosphaerae TaxID=88374 RepID=A0A9W6FNX8_9MICO|nr:MFS transporter [Agromyces rhizosphaerae]GLI26971.1 putative MFS-type transporter YdeG [Agromyces rhizosphaerae]